MEGQQKEIQYTGYHKDMGKDCELDRIIRFLRRIGMLEEI